MNSHHADIRNSTLSVSSEWKGALHSQIGEILEMAKLEADGSHSFLVDVGFPIQESLRLASDSFRASSSSMPSGSEELPHKLVRESSKPKLTKLGSSPWNLKRCINQDDGNLSSGPPPLLRSRSGDAGFGPPPLQRTRSGDAGHGPPPLLSTRSGDTGRSHHLLNQGSTGSLRSSSGSMGSGGLGLSRRSTSNFSNSSPHNASASFRNEHMIIQIAQRSSSKEVKSILTQLAGDNPLDEKTVESYCSSLALLVSDSYYQVIVSKYGGALILCHLMKTYPDNTSIQESCCSCLERMPHHPHMRAYGGQVLKECLERNPQSIHIQSAACQALEALLEHAKDTDVLALPDDLDDLLEVATHMYLTPNGRRAADRVRHLLSERQR